MRVGSSSSSARDRPFGRTSSRDRPLSSSARRTRLKPFECSPLDGRPIRTSPAETCWRPRSSSRRTSPTQNPARSNRPASSTPGCSAVSPPSNAQRARRHPSATPATISATSSRDHAADGQVVEEEQRLGTRAHHVVGGHRHQIDAHRIQPAGQPGHLELGAHPVRAGRQEPPVAQVVEPGEPAHPVDHLGPRGAGSDLLDQLQRAGRRRRDRPPRRGSCSPGAHVGLGHRASSANFDGVSSPTGTG